MGRPKRAADGGLIYHVLNRANAKMRIFEEDEDYLAFERIVQQAIDRTKTRLLAYCVMPNHWHLVVWPRQDGELSQFAGWLTLTHTQRWHANRDSAGSGHLYQGRFKSFPVQDDSHFYTVVRYVERNALRANLVERAEDWPWGSLFRAKIGSLKIQPQLTAWPLARPQDWIEYVNTPLSDNELAALRRCVIRGNPFGEPQWCNQMVRRLGLQSTLRAQGRPRKNF
jgi:putative transposase